MTSHLTTSQAAAALGITPRAVQQAITRGKLKATKAGRDWLIKTRDVEAYRRECHVPRTQGTP